MTAPVVVIGSGVAGLAAAGILAHHGREVVLVERIKSAAPLLRGYCRGDWYCDVGLHYLGGFAPGGMLDRFFSGLGLRNLEPRPLDQNGFDRIHWPGWDLEFRVPVGFAAFEERLCSLFPRSRRAVQAWVEVARGKVDSTPFLNPDVPPWQAVVGEHDRKGLAAFLRDHGAEDRLITLLGRYGAGLFGVDETSAPLVTHAMVIGSYLQSAHTLVGGGAALADSFCERLGELGVRFKGARTATSIRFDAAGQVKGVALSRDEYVQAGAVVFTPHPALLPPMLELESLRAAYDKRVRRLVDTTSLFLTHVASRTHRHGGNHNDFVFFDDAENADMPHLAAMAGSPPRTGEAASLCLIAAAPPGFGGPDRRAYRRHKAEFAQRSLDLASRFVPGVDEQSLILETASPQTFARWTQTRGGSAYGALRPVGGRRLNAHTPSPNLLLAGQSVLYPGIMGAIASAMVACCHIVGADKVWELLRE